MKITLFSLTKLKSYVNFTSERRHKLNFKESRIAKIAGKLEEYTLSCGVLRQLFLRILFLQEDQYHGLSKHIILRFYADIYLYRNSIMIVFMCV